METFLGDSIRSVELYPVLNSAGEMVVEARVHLTSGICGSEASPTGTTKGPFDAPDSGIDALLARQSEIQSALLKLSCDRQEDVDSRLVELCGGFGFRSCASNLSTAVSLAVCRAAATNAGLPIYEYIAQLYGTKISVPTPILNLLNCGAHTGARSIIAEVMVVPRGKELSKALHSASSLFQGLRQIMEGRYGRLSHLSGIEGGLSPLLADPREALGLIREAIDRCGFTAEFDLAIDVAAESVLQGGLYCVEGAAAPFSSSAYKEYLFEILDEFSEIVYIEDPFAATDDAGWRHALARYRTKLIVADDLTSTDSGRIEAAAAGLMANAVILKVNQVGTLSGFVQAYRTCKACGLATITSHRSRETDSDFVSHLAIGLGTPFFKAGACARERIIKYNALIRCERNLAV